KVSFENDGVLKSFSIGETRYVMLRGSNERFYGYMDVSVFSKNKVGGSEITSNLVTLIEDSRLRLEELKNGSWVFARSNENFALQTYINCICSYRWRYESQGNPLYGMVQHGVIPLEAIGTKFNCKGSECESLTNLADGPGSELYLYILRNDPDLTAQQLDSLRQLSNYITQNAKNK